MSETIENNPFIDAMTSDKEQLCERKQSNTTSGITIYDVNPRAETILNTAIKVGFVIYCIICIAGFLGGIIASVSEYEGIYLLISLGSLFLFLIALILWAFGKVLINISRNLFNINEEIKKK